MPFYQTMLTLYLFSACFTAYHLFIAPFGCETERGFHLK